MVRGAGHARARLGEHVVRAAEGAGGAGVALERLGVPLESGVADAAGDGAGAVAAERRRVRGAGRAHERAVVLV